jgi:DNA-binding GntR family transcriptional regulator
MSRKFQSELMGPRDALRSPGFLGGRRPGDSRFSDLVAEHLKALILDGDLRAGDPIIVADIGRQLGVSRQPVMEALKRIEADGVIEIVPQVGCRVSRPGTEEIEDFFQMFAAMEAEMSALAAGRHSEEEAKNFATLLSDLSRALDLSESATPAKNHRLLNRGFHGAIHDMAKSPHVARLSSALWDRSDFYVKTAFGAFQISSRVREAYARISRGILARNADAARAATREHLIVSGRAASRRLRANPAGPPRAQV